jgi:hypothetical protein
MEIGKLSRLAYERVMNVKNLDDLLNIFELTPEQFAEIEANPTFQRILEHYNIEWNSALNTGDRVKLRSAAWLEDNLDILGTRMVDPTTPLSSSVDVGKFFARLAGFGEKKDDMPSAEKFSIVINIGEGKKVELDHAVDITSKELARAVITDKTE